MASLLPSGTVTILFTDVEGSTGIANVHGDPSAHEILRVQRQIVRAAVARHDGHEVKTMGDGFMLAFASARNGVTCAMEIQRALAEHNRRHHALRVVVRMGLNTGEAIREENDLFGNAVAAAERIMKKAKGGEILVSEALRSVVGTATDIRLRDRGRFRLKGFPDRWRLYEAVWQDAPAEPPEIADLDRTPFVARERECATLDDVLRGTVAGEGSLVLIAGEPGVGKTRLASHIMAAGRRGGMMTLAGRCYEEASAPPYAPFSDILESAARTLSREVVRDAFGDSLPDVARLMPAAWRDFGSVAPTVEMQPSDLRSRMFAGVSTFLARASATQPMIVLIDDLQWADEGTAQLLVHIAGSIGRLRLMVVATLRDMPSEVTPHVSRALAEVHRRHLARRIELARFGSGDVRAMLAALSGRDPPDQLSSAMFAETDGNAFFIEEVFKHLSEEGLLLDDAGEWRSDVRIGELGISRGLRHVIEQRLERLTDGARALLCEAAVIGRAFTLTLLESVSRLSDDALFDALDAAERANLIVALPNQLETTFSFAHELMRHALLDEMGTSERQRIHLRAAHAIEALPLHDRERFVESLAYHYTSAGRLGEPERVIAALRQAGDAALAVSAHSAADAHYRAALRLITDHPETPAPERALVLHRFAQAQYRLGHLKASEEALEAALAIYRSEGMREQVAEALFLKAVVCTFDAKAMDALTLLADAKESVSEGTRLDGLILVLEAQNLVQLRRYEQASAAIDRALGLAEQLDDTYLRVRARIASGYYGLTTLDLGRAAVDLERVLATERIGVHERMAAESRRAIALAGLGRLDEASAAASSAQAFFASVDDPYELGFASLPLAVAAIAQARFDEARVIMDDAMTAGSEPPNPWVQASLLPLMLQTRYAIERAAEVVEFAQTLERAGESRRTPAVVRLCLALRAAARGEEASPGAVPPRSGQYARPDAQTLAYAVLEAETAIMLQSADFADAAFEPLNELYRRGMLFTSGWVALLPRLLGALRRIRGEWDQAEQSLRHALEVASRTSATAELAATHLEFAELFACRLDVPDRGAAAAHLGEGRRLAAQAGVTMFARRFASLDDALRA